MVVRAVELALFGVTVFTLGCGSDFAALSLRLPDAGDEPADEWSEDAGEVDPEQPRAMRDGSRPLPDARVASSRSDAQVAEYVVPEAPFEPQFGPDGWVHCAPEKRFYDSAVTGAACTFEGQTCQVRKPCQVRSASCVEGALALTHATARDCDPRYGFDTSPHTALITSCEAALAGETGQPCDEERICASPVASSPCCLQLTRCAYDEAGQPRLRHQDVCTDCAVAPTRAKPETRDCTELARATAAGTLGMLDGCVGSFVCSASGDRLDGAGQLGMPLDPDGRLYWCAGGRLQRVAIGPDPGVYTPPVVQLVSDLEVVF